MEIVTQVVPSVAVFPQERSSQGAKQDPSWPVILLQHSTPAVGPLQEKEERDQMSQTFDPNTQNSTIGLVKAALASSIFHS